MHMSTIIAELSQNPITYYTQCVRRRHTPSFFRHKYKLGFSGVYYCVSVLRCHRIGYGCDAAATTATATTAKLVYRTLFHLMCAILRKLNTYFFFVCHGRRRTRQYYYLSVHRSSVHTRHDWRSPLVLLLWMQNDEANKMSMHQTWRAHSANTHITSDALEIRISRIRQQLDGCQEAAISWAK